MNFAKLNINNMEDILKAFGLNKDVPIFKTSEMPADYNGILIRKSINVIERCYALQVEQHFFKETYNFQQYNTHIVNNFNGPARIEFDTIDNGYVISVFYYIENSLHNPLGPACIYYNYEGKKIKEEYYIRGKRHNNVAPAVIYYDRDPMYNRHFYYVNNYRVNKPAFFNRLNVLSK